MNIRAAANICAPLGYQECELCHRIARDVALRPVIKYQSGAGVVEMLQCEDVTECWLRADEQEKVTA